MLLSMTGFGRATADLPDKHITVEIKSLNSKQMDLNTRMPGCYRETELEMRGRVGRRLERGKVDLSVSVEKTVEGNVSRINPAALKAYKEQIDAINSDLGLPEPADWHSLLLHLPDCMMPEGDKTLSDGEKEALLRTLDEAVEGLMQHRRAEGERLETFFRLRIGRIASLLKEVEPLEGERVALIRAKIEDGLSKISVADYDKGRLEQEMIYYIEKLDVSEEKQRLGQHLRYFIETMEQPAPGQGKKLGFIAQEMGREINTLGSKSNHAGMQKLVVRMKDELEQIKEQVLNVM